MKTRSNLVVTLLTGLAIASTTGALTGCSNFTGALSDETISAVEDSDVDEVMERFGSMTEVIGNPAGDTEIEVSEPGMVWALVRRDDQSNVAPASCLIEGSAMEKPSEALNIPEPKALRDGEKQHTLLAFAEGSVEGPGTYTVTCDLDASALLFMFEPKG